MLAGLIRTTGTGVSHRVMTLLGGEDFFGLDPGIVHAHGKGPGVHLLGCVDRLRRIVGTWRPQVVHAWMYHANLLTAAVRGMPSRIIWSIHNSDLDPRWTRMRTRLVNRTLAMLSPFVPDAIVYVAEEVRRLHEGQGYNAAKGMVVANGIDPARFQPSLRPPGAGVDRPAILALIGRYNPQKGHHFLIDVLARHERKENIHLMFVGNGCDTAPLLRNHLMDAGLMDHTTLLGATQDIERIYAQADVVVLPALYGEAMPLVLLEAAATGAVICASRVGGIGSLKLPRTVLFDRGDDKGCAAALTEALTLAALSHTPAPLPDRYHACTAAVCYSALYHDLSRR